MEQQLEGEHLKAIRANSAYKNDPDIKKVDELTDAQHGQVGQKDVGMPAFSLVHAETEKKTSNDDFSKLALQMRNMAFGKEQLLDDGETGRVGTAKEGIGCRQGPRRGGDG